MSDIQADPKTTASYRMLRAVVIVLGALIVIALGVIVVGLILKFNNKTHAPVYDTAGFAMPPNAQIIEMQSQPNRLILHIHSLGGDEIDIIDTGDGHLISRVKAAHAK